MSEVENPTKPVIVMVLYSNGKSTYSTAPPVSHLFERRTGKRFLETNLGSEGLRVYMEDNPP